MFPPSANDGSRPSRRNIAFSFCSNIFIPTARLLLEEGGVYPHFADESSEARQSRCDFARDHRLFNGSRNSKPFVSAPVLSPSTIQSISHVSFSLINPLFRASTAPYGHQALGTQKFGRVLEVLCLYLSCLRLEAKVCPFPSPRADRPFLRPGCGW